MTQPHVEPPPTPPIKSKHDDKPDKDFVKLKLRRDPASSSLDLYEFNMALFGNGNPEEFFLFVQNFNINIAMSRMLATGVKIQYLHTLVRG